VHLHDTKEALLQRTCWASGSQRLCLNHGRNMIIGATAVEFEVQNILARRKWQKASTKRHQLRPVMLAHQFMPKMSTIKLH
jgi:hypothetical protein